VILKTLQSPKAKKRKSGFTFSLHYYELAQCVGLDLYTVPPRQRNREAIASYVNEGLKKIGLDLIKRPLWIDEWAVCAIDGWTGPREYLYKAGFECFQPGQILHRESRKPDHIFVESNIGFLVDVLGRGKLWLDLTPFIKG
jgi:hypothetical protein